MLFSAIRNIDVSYRLKIQRVPLVSDILKMSKESHVASLFKERRLETLPK